MILKVNAGRFKVPLSLESVSENRLKASFRYNKILVESIKNMRGAKWEPEPNKFWTIDDCRRNWFQLNFLQGNNVYARYDIDLKYPDFIRQLFDHQKEMVAHGLIRRQCIFACEMGTGKTLAGIEIMERSGFEDWWWIGPKSALAAVELEFWKWSCLIKPKMYTYDGLKRILKHWKDGTKAPQGVIFDESSKLKTHTSQRSEAAMHLVEAMRSEHENPFIILMSGSPAPKNPIDWWHQSEIACPGFLKEGHPLKLKKSLALVVNEESITGGIFPKLITWWDDDNKCRICGKYEKEGPHEAADVVFDQKDTHQFEKSVNEVFRLYKRLKGLVLIKMKKECLNLPDKIYREIKLEPSESTLRAAGIIVAKSPRTITALTLLRELSDGFQYEEVEGTRIVKEIPTPKEEILKELLEEHEDIGRVVIYAGFSASVDRCTKICQREGWNVIQVDGRGWQIFGFVGIFSNAELLAFFQSDDSRKIAFVGQPGAGGMGITLTKSPSIVYWSNDFIGESRIQSEDRIHRIGMDTNRGANIIDLIHLPTDKLVLDNLKKKRQLQDLSLGTVQVALTQEQGEAR